MSVEQNAAAQQVLNDLLAEGRLPFKLTVGDLLAHDEYGFTVAFHDSRLHHVDFLCEEDDSFADNFRAAVLVRVKRMSGPLYMQARAAQSSP